MFYIHCTCSCLVSKITLYTCVFSSTDTTRTQAIVLLVHVSYDSCRCACVYLNIIISSGLCNVFGAGHDHTSDIFCGDYYRCNCIFVSFFSFLCESLRYFSDRKFMSKKTETPVVVHNELFKKVSLAHQRFYWHNILYTRDISPYTCSYHISHPCHILYTRKFSWRKNFHESFILEYFMNIILCTSACHPQIIIEFHE